MPFDMSPSQITDYERIERAVHYLESHFREQPSLGEVAKSAGLSEFHFQRMFQRWAGISPKRFVQYLMAGQADRALRESRNLLDATLEAGLSSPSRLHGLFVSLHAMTPAEWRDAGAGLEIRYGIHDGPFGCCLIAETDRGVCALNFLTWEGESLAIEQLRERWVGARLVRDQAATRTTLSRIFGRADPQTAPLSVWVRGTNFQVKVWEALLRIAPGQVSTYQDIANAIDAPKATRAVGSAVGRNPVAYLIPCHRVIRKSGVIGDYRWGTVRKKAILALEWAREAEFWETGKRSPGPSMWQLAGSDVI
jgi:AraC family transcriptional regulator of adaptative response/methylated-DNA-[protein]-cysteine methyltransferase